MTARVSIVMDLVAFDCARDDLVTRHGSSYLGLHRSPAHVLASHPWSDRPHGDCGQRVQGQRHSSAARSHLVTFRV